MPFTPPKESYNGKTFELTIGQGDKAVTVGGENVLAFHAFEGSVPREPAVAFEVQDMPPDDWPETVAEVFKNVSSGPVTWGSTSST